MIQANELRIGNWVEPQFNGMSVVTPLQVTGMFIRQVSALESAIADNYNPIQLTPEILEKCGFIMVKEDFWQKLNVTIILTKDGNNLCFVYVEEILNAPKSLHQLQNLYFALTGEELTYKP